MHHGLSLSEKRHLFLLQFALSISESNRKSIVGRELYSTAGGLNCTRREHTEGANGFRIYGINILSKLFITRELVFG